MNSCPAHFGIDIRCEVFLIQPERIPDCNRDGTAQVIFAVSSEPTDPLIPFQQDISVGWVIGKTLAIHPNRFVDVATGLDSGSLTSGRNKSSP